MAKRRSSKRRSNKRRSNKGGQPTDNGSIETPQANGSIETPPANGIVETIETPPVAVVDVATAPEVSISGGGLVEIAVPAALIYSSTVLKKKFPSRHQYTSNKSRQILHWRKKARRTQRRR
jgi:hypothetical protein